MSIKPLFPCFLSMLALPLVAQVPADTLVSPAAVAGGVWGWSVAGVGGDVDGDGVFDWLVGAPGESEADSLPDAGRAYLISGTSGQVRQIFRSPRAEENGNFGFTVAGLGGDIDGDSVPDVAIGAPFETVRDSLSLGGRVYLFSGADGRLIAALASPHPEAQGRFGLSLAGAVGDLNGDDVPDLLVGAYFENPGAAPTDAGRAYLFSGADRSLIRTLRSPSEAAGGSGSGSDRLR